MPDTTKDWFPSPPERVWVYLAHANGEAMWVCDERHSGIIKQVPFVPERRALEAEARLEMLKEAVKKVMALMKGGD